jgi:peptidase M1-like protein
MQASASLRLCVYFFFLLIIHKSYGQQEDLYIPRNIQKAFDNGTRAPDGKPGKNYWQNFADYDLKIKFNPKSRLVEGTEFVTYYNKSPDTLKQIIIRLYPDFYKKGNLRDYPVDVKDESEGVTIEKLILNDVTFSTSEKGPQNVFVSGYDLNDSIPAGFANENRTYLSGTNLTIQGKAILPEQTSKLEIKWHYTLNKGSHVRTGQVDDGAFFIAYCFPRIVVYDDIDGWDENKYLGNNESYFDFGDFKAEITVPKNYTVWATGELQNANEIFRESIVQKINSAKVSDKIVNVIDSLDLRNKNIFVSNKWNTFKFKAAHVPDFTFAVSNHYLWQSGSIVVDSVSKRRAVINTVFDKNHLDYFEVYDFSRKTIEVMSFDFPGVAFPYPHITIFDGLDQMEYPMMINDNPEKDRKESITLTDHEIFHTLFPFYMGTNQTKYAWMDEGWATVGEWYISSKIDSSVLDTWGVSAVKATSGKEYDLPLIIPSTETKESYYINAYPKPALVYWYLKDMLGDSLFRKSIQHYMNSWNGKHPLPWDFFNAVNTASGMDLNWFWKAWFYDYGAIDLGIKKVIVKDSAYDVIVEMKGNKPAPVFLNVEFRDGMKKIIHQSALVWKSGNKEFIISINEHKSVSKITLHDSYVPDVNEKDNEYTF